MAALFFSIFWRPLQKAAPRSADLKKEDIYVKDS